MTFTYSSSDLSTNLAKTRRLLGDTDSTDPLLTDEEINFFISEADSNVYSAAASAALAIQAKFAREAVDTKVESVSVSYSKRAEAYASLARDLEAKAADEDLPTPSVFGISKDAISDTRSDSDRIDERFFQGQFDNPSADSIKVDGQDV